FDPATPQGKKQIANFLLPQIKKITNSIVVSHWAQKLSNALGVSIESISEELKKLPFQNITQNHTEQANSAPALAPLEKNRQQLLEEKILSLTLKSPKLLDFMDQDDINLFSPQFKTVLTCFKEKAVCDMPTIQEAVKDFDNNQEVKLVLDNCFFQSETEQIDDPEQEIQVCLEGFRRVSWQDQLKKYGDELKLAEREGNLEKRKQVMDKINSLTKNRPA
ncbi:MAG: hypothetical protein PHY72_04455, partial [Candidatus Pacebacteria bacterium]|nr:hypothetical protein [Candidatus Paceibacterota bacterium]